MYMDSMRKYTYLCIAHIIKAENCQQNMTAETGMHVPVKKYKSGYQFW